MEEMVEDLMNAKSMIHECDILIEKLDMLSKEYGCPYTWTNATILCYDIENRPLGRTYSMWELVNWAIHILKYENEIQDTWVTWRQASNIAMDSHEAMTLLTQKKDQLLNLMDN